MFLKSLGAGLLVICAVGVAGAQTAAAPNSPPPVKMGLWQTSVTSQLQGIHLPPMVVEQLKQMSRPVPGEPYTTVTQSCLTPAQWRKSLEGVSKPPNSDCTVDKHEVNDRNFSFSLSCKTENGMTVTGHWEMRVVDKEHAHGSGDVKSIQPGAKGQNYTATTTIDSHYVSASCGDVKPGQPKVVQ
ncbi:MAG TPA: DUF3617 domain-containing protein [Acidobacteriaceae bacterium]|nr:DUF3617 domain-containing protein [Acidobacteriaceae bacterium]